MGTPLVKSQTSESSSDLFGSEDPEFLAALGNAVLPGDISVTKSASEFSSQPSSGHPPTPPCGQPGLKRRHSPSPSPTRSAFPRLLRSDEELPEVDQYIYGASRFGEYGEYMRRKRAKLQIQNVEMDEGEKGRIFRGLEIYINGWTEPSVQDLRQLILQHGGVFHAYLDRKSLVTHIITCSLTPAKIREFKHMKVVRPEWLVESSKAGSLLPWQNYAFRPVERIEENQGGKSAQRGLDGFISQSQSVGNDIDGSPDIELSMDVDTAPQESSSGESIPRVPLADPSKLRTTVSVQSLSKADNALPDTDASTTVQAAEVPSYAAKESNPFAQRVMADPEWRSAHTSAAPDFIKGFYENSRLHHLSTWKAELKGLVSEALARVQKGETTIEGGWIKDDGVDDGVKGGEVVEGVGEVAGVSMKGAELVMRSPSKYGVKGKAKAIEADDRVIMHCDFDSFFVAAGLVDRPHLRGKPIVVCHSQGSQGGGGSTSEIASASYEARKFGIKNGMSLQQARKLCPTIMTIPYEFERYKQFSLQFYTILMGHADDLQAVSVDEALIDVTTTVVRLRAEAVAKGQVSADPAKEFAETIRADVKRVTGCEVSIGIAHNILLARLATRRAKPASSFHLLPAEVSSFLAPLDIRDLWGFGWSTQKKAEEKLGTTNLGDLTKKSKGVLCDALGKGTGETLYKAVRGIDEKKLESDKPRKSVSSEISYGIRFDSNAQAEKFVYQMAEEVARRLKDIDMRGRSMTLKVMKRDPSAPVEAAKFLGHGMCETFNRHAALPYLTSDENVIGEYAWQLLNSFNFEAKELRGIGIQIQKLEGKNGPTATGVEAGQGKLPFKPVHPSTEAPAVNLPMLVVQPPSFEREGGGDEMQACDPSRLEPTVSTTTQLPSFSQVDKEVFDALPDDLRHELEVEYKRRSVTPVPRPMIFPPAPPPKPPAKITVKGVNVKRITQQLAPRNRPVLTSPKKSTLFSKKDGPVDVNISDAQLRELDIDPDVFAILPADVQKEQLAMARSAKNAGGASNFIRARKVIKPFNRISRSPSAYYRRPRPKANHLRPSFLKQKGSTKGEKLFFTDTDDVQRVIEKWVDGFKESPPNAKDVEFFSKFLMECVDGKRSTDAGVEKAVGVVKWWLVLLRRYWKETEFDEVTDGERSQPEERASIVGRVWWKAFREVKGKMDVVVRKKFGGSLSLK